jgi:hypothetical protein
MSAEGGGEAEAMELPDPGEGGSGLQQQQQPQPREEAAGRPQQVPSSSVFFQLSVLSLTMQ